MRGTPSNVARLQWKTHDLGIITGGHIILDYRGGCGKSIRQAACDILSPTRHSENSPDANHQRVQNLQKTIS